MENERCFDDVLMRVGIVTHYLPRSKDNEEKGIDVWFALEAYELAVYKRFNVLVLIACDGDYVPLVRKLNTLGTRVMLFGWGFKYMDRKGKENETRTSQALINEVTYFVPMHTVIEDRSPKNKQEIDGLFLQMKIVPDSSSSTPPAREIWTEDQQATSGLRRGKINSLKGGYGFISDPVDGKSRFFHYSSLPDEAFNNLKVGDELEFEPVEDDKSGKAINLHLVKHAG